MQTFLDSQDRNAAIGQSNGGGTDLVEPRTGRATMNSMGETILHRNDSTLAASQTKAPSLGQLLRTITTTSLGMGPQGLMKYFIMW